ncbi:DUF5041 domain-containing protein [Maribellus comscasis]|uniref:DUF5041 domain-containing protein n=1 Tax=Maribellus comscasis TaxID=2681766 RepID=A0A6I6JJ79_9BACT|nr:DUF5041 domain-containing protein [Maribellus comscasis]QGY42915.1 DUF5041 domain-containing protein [Maribellus comscasis]
MKRFTFLSLFFIFYSTLLFSQKLVTELNSGDIRSALKLANIEIHKFNFSEADTVHNLTIYLDEIADDSIINHKEYNFGRWSNDLTKRQLKIMSKIDSAKDSVYFITLSHPGMQLSARFDISPEFCKNHAWMDVKQDEILYDKKTPLLFFGMFWEDEFNGQKVYRFCWGEEVTREMNNVSLDQIDHMILVSYELKD